MRHVIYIFLLLLTFSPISHAQESQEKDPYDKHSLVWTTGLFKSWLKDHYVDFNKIGDLITPVFSEEKKMGFSFTSHYLYHLTRWFGIGAHLGIGLDVYSYQQAPVLLFGGSISLGDHLIIDAGWADSKRRVVPDGIRDKLNNTTYTKIPVIHEYTELNTNWYLGIGVRVF